MSFAEKHRAAQQQAGALGSISSALSNMTTAISSSQYLASASDALNKSKVLINANDSIKRTVGFDIRKAIGGKSAAEIAEERLK